MSKVRARGRWLFWAILLGASLLVGGLGRSRYRLASDPLARGWAAYSRGDWEAAAVQARARLKAAAQDPEGLRLLARSSVRLGRDAAATSWYRRLGPAAMQVEDLYLLGLVLSRTGKTESAIAVWRRARALDPGHTETLFELTRASYAADALESAARLGRLLAARPGWESRAEWILGMIQLARDDPAGAVAYWQRALGRDGVPREGAPWPVVSRKELARALLRAGRPREARDQVRIVRRPAPDRDPEADWLASRVALQQGAWDEARAALATGGSFRDEDPQLPDPAPYVGSARCAECHPAEFKAQQGSRHARTFFRDSELGGLVVPVAAVPDPADPKVLHVLRRREGGRMEQETRVDGQVFDAVVQYAFGSGDRGLTLVGRDDNGDAYELRLSEYPDGSRACWDLTVGQPRTPPRADQFLGKPLSEDAVRRCLSCHVTDTRAVLDRSGASASDRGIGCEKCHGPGGNHLRAAEGNLIETDPAIGRPTLVSGARIVKLCAECHSPRNRDVGRDDPSAVRFQGTTLTWSRCFTESNDTFDCTTCHDPHRNASTSASHYESRCLSCHSGTGTGAGAAATEGVDGRRPESSSGRSRREGPSEAPVRTTCPVNPTRGCIGCHMPAVGGIVPHSSFTDHFIRVHHD